MRAGGRAGGSITAALFLKEFVKEGVEWAHLDIAGPVSTATGNRVPAAAARPARGCILSSSGTCIPRGMRSLAHMYTCLGKLFWVKRGYTGYWRSLTHGPAWPLAAVTAGVG